MAESLRETSNRSACTECQRRKQKCNREWPCNHCQKRKVADRCRFNNPVPPFDKPSQDAGRKRRQVGHESPTSSGNNPSSDDDQGFESLGYMATEMFAGLGLDSKKEKPVSRQFWADPKSCSQLDRALKVLPDRSRMDSLVQTFFSNVNFHYYIVYPPMFLEEYQAWWERRSRGRPLGVQWTCLLLMVCACSVQHLDVEMQEMIETDAGESAQVLTERYHNTARELSSVTPLGEYHLYNVQWLLHSVYWYKAEARFLECWHVLNAAAREGQELGLNKQSAAEHLPEFEREMRRRVWCIIDTWDWQVSSGLSRPTVVDRTDSDVAQPTLTLEDFDPSPLLQMRLQSELITKLAAKYAAPKKVVTPTQVLDYKSMIEEWMHNFPRHFRFENPDTSQDKKHPWVIFHRYYLYTMAYLMILNPMRVYLSKQYTKDSPEIELQIRSEGVDYSLKNLATTEKWAGHVSHRDGRFHFVIFSLFDTAAVLTTAVIKDVERTLPRRDEVVAAIDNAMRILGDLNNISQTAKMSHDILSKVVNRLPRAEYESADTNRKRSKMTAGMPMYDAGMHVADMIPPHMPGTVPMQPSLGADFVQVRDLGSSQSSPSNYIGAEHYTPTSSATGYVSDGPPVTLSTDPTNSFASSYAAPVNNAPINNAPINNAPVGFTDFGMPPMIPGMPDFGFESISDAELGQLANSWNWDTLGLDPGQGPGPGPEGMHPYDTSI